MGNTVDTTEKPESDGKVLFGWCIKDKQSGFAADEIIGTKKFFAEDTTLYAVRDEPVERIPSDKIPNATEKKHDKAYITLIFDDNRNDLDQFYDIIVGEYGLPMCCAVPGNTLGNGNLELLRKIEAAGGEILSHMQTHLVLNRSVKWSSAEREFAESKKNLTDAGFNVNGIILAGGGGTEDTTVEYRAELEGLTAKYYSYSDNYGAKTQFHKPRQCFNNWGEGRGKTFEELKVHADEAIAGKTWLVIYAHNTKECPPDTLRRFIDYMQTNGAEFVTYKTAYETLFDWDEPVDFSRK